MAVVMELKSPEEIAIMRESGRILARVMHEVFAAVDVGVTTGDLDKLALDRIRAAKAKPAFLGQYGFPKTLCISVNEEIVHGIPGKRRLEAGDIVSVDCGVIFRGWYSDMAFTKAVGEPSPTAKKLLEVTSRALELAIEQCHPGKRLGDIGWAVQSHVESNGFSVVEDYGGHGVGQEIHMDPRVENVGKPGTGRRMLPGLVLALEPMVSVGTGKNKTLEDGWTVVTEDGSPAAHFEHTVAITEEGPRVLTLLED